MITPTNNSNHPGMTPPYDPMAVQFMTQGRMQHMPEAQFLSPSDYGAFRGMPGPHQGIMPQQQQSLWQAYMTSTRGSPLGMLPDYTMASYQMGHDQSMHHTMAQRRVQDAQGVGGAMAANYGLNATLSMGLAGGNPLLAAPIGAAMPDFGAPMTDRIAQQRQIQDMSMSRIAVGPDRAAGLGQGFGAPAAARVDESVRREGAGDILFKEEDYREIMKTGIQEGLFDFDHSASEYQRTISQLRDNINVMGEILGSTDFKELTQGMKRLMTMGADLDQMGEVTQMERMFSRMTGMRHDQMVATHGQQGAMIYSQAGLTNYQGSLAAMSHAADVTMSQRLGILDPGTLSRHGGASGMTQELTQQQARGIRQTQDFYLPYLANEDFTGLGDDFRETIDSVMRGDMGAQELSQGGRRIQDVNDYARYEGHRPQIQQELQDELGPVGFQLFQRQLALDVGEQMGGGTTEEQLFIGFREFWGYDEEMARQQAAQWSSQEFTQGQIDQTETEQRRLTYSALEQRKHDDSPFNRASIWARESINELHTPYKRWSDRRGRRVQREEDARLGVHSIPGAEGMSGLGEMDYEEYHRYTRDWDLDDMIDEHIRGSMGQDEIDFELGTGSGTIGNRLRQLTIRGLGGDVEQESIQRGRALRRAHGAAIDSWDDFDERVREMDPSLSPAVLRQHLSDMESVDDLDRESMEARTTQAIIDSRDMSGFSDEQRRIYTEEIAPERARDLMADDDFTELAYGGARRASESFDLDVLRTFEDRASDAYGESLDDMEEFREDYRKRFREFVGSGIFGIADRQQQRTLEDLVEHDPRGADMYSLQVLQTKYAGENDPDAKRRLRQRFTEIAKRLGWSDQQIRTTLEASGGLESRQALRYMTEDLGYSEEEARELVSIGRDVGGQIEDEGATTAISDSGFISGEPGRGRSAADRVLEMTEDVTDLQRRRAAEESGRILNRFQDLLDDTGYTVDDLRDAGTRERILQETDDNEVQRLVRASGRLESQAESAARGVFDELGVDISDIESAEDLEGLSPESGVERSVVDATRRRLEAGEDLTFSGIASGMTEDDFLRQVATYTAHADGDPYSAPDSSPEHVAKEGQEETLQNLDNTVRGLHQIMHTLNDTLLQSQEVHRNTTRAMQSL